MFNDLCSCTMTTLLFWGESWGFHLCFQCFSKLFQRWVTHKACDWIFHFINLLYISAIRPQQSNSWAGKREKKERLVHHIHISSHPRAVSAGAELDSSYKCTGNSHKLEPGKFQGERSKKFPVRATKFCNKLPKEHAVTAVWQTLRITLDNAPSKWTWAGPALGRRWKQESLPKIGMWV